MYVLPGIHRTIPRPHLLLHAGLPLGQGVMRVEAPNEHVGCGKGGMRLKIAKGASARQKRDVLCKIRATRNEQQEEHHKGGPEKSSRRSNTRGQTAKGRLLAVMHEGGDVDRRNVPSGKSKAWPQPNTV